MCRKAQGNKIRLIGRTKEKSLSYEGFFFCDKMLSRTDMRFPQNLKTLPAWYFLLWYTVFYYYQQLLIYFYHEPRTRFCRCFAKFK
jgi:hypothetical protein